jgi:5'(3')-deoxyribonucleotidase
MKNLTIAIDFDDTFTAAPALWAQFIKAARDAGHRVICVTARDYTEENIEEVDAAFAEHGIEIATWYTSLRSKIKHMEKAGVKVDIWIDDNPQVLVNGF